MAANGDHSKVVTKVQGASKLHERWL
jgi:hypothetical protein